MGKSLDDFKQFVKVHPGLNDLVKRNSRSWQEIYEEWTFYNDDARWESYKDNKSLTIIPVVKNEESINTDIKDEIKPTASNIEDMMKNALSYVKKINPDSITKTVSNAQKLLALVSGLGIGTSAGIAKNANTGDPLFDKRFDEWY